MSFSEIISSIGQGASSIGSSLKGLFASQGDTGTILKNPATGALEQAPQQNLWGQMMARGEKGEPSLWESMLRSGTIKFGGVPIKQVGVQPSLLKKGKYKGGPALSTEGGLHIGKEEWKSWDKFVENYEKALKTRREHKAWQQEQANLPTSWVDAYESGGYEVPNPSPSWDVDDESWDDFIRKDYFGTE